MGKFSAARNVWMPQYAEDGTNASPSRSCSGRMSALSNEVSRVFSNNGALVVSVAVLVDCLMMLPDILVFEFSCVREIFFNRKKIRIYLKNTGLMLFTKIKDSVGFFMDCSTENTV